MVAKNMLLEISSINASVISLNGYALVVRFFAVVNGKLFVVDQTWSILFLYLLLIANHWIFMERIPEDKLAKVIRIYLVCFCIIIENQEAYEKKDIEHHLWPNYSSMWFEELLRKG